MYRTYNNSLTQFIIADLFRKSWTETNMWPSCRIIVLQQNKSQYNDFQEKKKVIMEGKSKVIPFQARCGPEGG